MPLPARHQRAVLLGPSHQENLALLYLASSAEAAGHHVELVGYNDRRDLESAVTATLAAQPDLVGIGIPFQYCIGDALLLARSLRAAGFSGHLTCGGHVPTFCHAELLRDGPFDSAVRHEGEHTLVALLDALGNVPRSSGAAASSGSAAPSGSATSSGHAGSTNVAALDELPGIALRTADGGVHLGALRPPSRDLDELPWPKRQPGSYVVAGVPVAFVLMARGCTGECHYCSIRAFSRSAGGPPFRMRAPEAIAEEVAHLYHHRSTKVFFVQDDLFVLMSEAATLRRVRELTEALSSRGVRDASFWVKGRPETITPPVIEAMRAMGVLHVFIGLESASEERLVYLGRTHRPIHNQRAIEPAREAGLIPSFNFMLFDPECTLEDIAVTLDFADTCLGLPWNLCRTEVYSGTTLLQRLEREGRLQGDYRSYGYQMRDRRAELMFRILRVCLHERAFALESLLNRLISLSFARQIHERYFPGPLTVALSRRVDALARVVQADTLAMVREALDLASRTDPDNLRAATQHALRLGLEAARRDREWYREARQLWDGANVRGALLGGAVTPVVAPRFNQTASVS